MKICLVRPHFPEPSTIIYPPLGLLTIAPYFDKKHIITFVDQQTQQLIGGQGFLNSYFDMIVFSAFTVQLPLVEKLIDQGKEFGITSKFVVGGPGVTSNPDYARSLVPSADLLFAGDGEYFAENINWFFDIMRSKVKECADYRGLPYSLQNKKIPDWNLTKNKQYMRTTGLGVETSRGCPFNCVMCTAHMIHGKQWVARKVLDVVNELRFLKHKYGCTRFYFADDNATVEPSRWINLMIEIAKANLGLSLSVPEGIQAHHLDYETLGYMQEAGLTRFTIGAESGSQRVLDKVINKGGLTVEKIEEVVRNAVKLGMKPSCFFVIGFIGETLEEANQTVEFAEKLRHLGAENCTVRNAIPMPGTRMFDIAKIEGYLTVPEENLFDFNFVHKSKHLLKTSEWNPEQINALVSKAQEQERTHIIHSNIFKHPRATLKFMLK